MLPGKIDPHKTFASTPPLSAAGTAMCASALAAARCARLLPRLLPHSTGSALRGSTLQPAGTLLHPARAGGGSSAATAARARCHSGSASSNASSSSSPANASTAAGASDKKRVVFCGTPEVRSRRRARLRRSWLPAAAPPARLHHRSGSSQAALAYLLPRLPRWRRWCCGACWRQQPSPTRASRWRPW